MNNKPTKEKTLNQIMYIIIIGYSIAIGSFAYIGNFIAVFFLMFFGFTLIAVIKDYYGIRETLFNSKWF